METIYAQALWEAIENGTKPHEAVANLKHALEARGRLALLPKIGRAFARIAERQSARTRLTLSVAREKDAKAALAEAKEALAALSVREFDLCETIDDSLIGGWRLEGRGILIDESWKKALLSIYNRATT